jgi:hypothetical protein
MTAMKIIVFLLFFLSALHTRAVCGASTSSGNTSSSLASSQERSVGDMTLAQFNDVSKANNFLGAMRTYIVTLELLVLERDELRAAQKKLAALEREPGISSSEQKRLQEKQTQIGLQIGAIQMVAERLFWQALSKIWHRIWFRMRQFFSWS